MFESIVNNLPRQTVFNLNPFIARANSLMPNNKIVNNTIAFVPFADRENFNRIDLLKIWKNNIVPMSSKILFTFWWGGISHQFQAPLFYTTPNFKKLLDLEEGLQTNLNKIVGTNFDEESFKAIYYNFKRPNGLYKLNGINSSFFTKIFEFYFQANREGENAFEPIIADKWTKIAVLADMIDTKFKWESVFTRPQINNMKIVQFAGGIALEFDKYMIFNNYIKKRSRELKIPVFQLEELMFGQGRDIMNEQNPRNIAYSIIENYFNI